MKVLRIEYENINVFDKGFCFDMTASDRVVDDNQVHKISNCIYLQKVISLIGINASGKTTALRLIKFVMDIVARHKNLEQANVPFGIIKDDTVIKVDFVISGKIFRLYTIIGLKKDSYIDIEQNYPYFFKEEIIYEKPITSVKKKADITKFDDDMIIMKRSGLTEQAKALLPDNQSIVLSITRYASPYIYNSIHPISNYLIKGDDTVNENILKLYDENISSITVKDNNVRIVFKNGQDYIYDNLIDASQVLSSGTIKGMHILNQAAEVFKKGGYMIIDEIENHMNKKLVHMIIDLFNDCEINQNGACLIFTTHYPEILDVMERKDNIYILRRVNSTPEIIKYSDYVKRNDIKKSDIILSNYIDGTAPNYENIQKVRKYICQRED